MFSRIILTMFTLWLGGCAKIIVTKIPMTLT